MKSTPPTARRSSAPRRAKPGPLWIMARRQTAGRGRSGRQWASEPGNLYASLLVTLACPPAVVPQLSLLAGVAVVDAIAQAAGGASPGLRLKWPNDVLIGQAKCAGILAESISGQGGGDRRDRHRHQSRLASDRSRPRGHAPGRARRAALTPEAMLGFLAAAMQRWLAVWDVRNGICRRCARPGSSALVLSAKAAASIRGRSASRAHFVGLDAGGALLMQDRAGTAAQHRLRRRDAGDGRCGRCKLMADQRRRRRQGSATNWCSWRSAASARSA